MKDRKEENTKQAISWTRSETETETEDLHINLNFDENVLENSLINVVNITLSSFAFLCKYFTEIAFCAQLILDKLQPGRTHYMEIW